MIHFNPLFPTFVDNFILNVNIVHKEIFVFYIRLCMRIFYNFAVSSK
jgi:hypothetical protein